MKKNSPLILLLCAAVILLSVISSNAANETAVGKLVYYEYDEFPYVLEIKGSHNIALEVALDKNIRNKSLDRLLGKIVRVSGPARVITAMTELHGLKIIDVRPGRGTIKALR